MSSLDKKIQATQDNERPVLNTYVSTSDGLVSSTMAEEEEARRVLRPDLLVAAAFVFLVVPTALVLLLLRPLQQQLLPLPLTIGCFALQVPPVMRLLCLEGLGKNASALGRKAPITRRHPAAPSTSHFPHHGKDGAPGSLTSISVYAYGIKKS